MKLSTREIAVFGMLGAVMYSSKVLMEIAPNVHLLGVFTMAFVHGVSNFLCGFLIVPIVSILRRLEYYME